MARRARSGFSLLELIVTASLMATLATTVTLVLRSSQRAWEAQQSDHARLEAAHATLRHVTRRLRQAEGIVAISDPAQASGSLSALLPDGSLIVWEHDAGQVRFGVNAATTVLANGISELTFAGYQADGATPTTVPEEIQSVRCTVLVELPRGNNAQQTIGCWAWIRSW